MFIRMFTLFIVTFLVLNTDAGTWLSFNQKTGGLSDEFFPISNAPAADLASLVRSCDEELIKGGGVMSSQQRRTVEMCKTLIDMISRK